MPHVVPKKTTVREGVGAMNAGAGATLDDVLQAIEAAGVNLIGITTDGVEEGTVGFLAKHVDEQKLLEVTDGFGLPKVDDSGGQHLDYVDHRPGGLVAALERARFHHPDKVIREIGVGVEKIRFVVYADDGDPPKGHVVRHNADGEPSETGAPVDDVDHAVAIAAGRQTDVILALPVSIFFI